MAQLPSSNPASIIGAGGGDYTTIASWEADLDNQTLDADYTAYLRDLAGDNSTIYFSGVDSTASYKAVLQAESGYEADGSDAAGAQVDVSIDLYEDSNQWNMDIIGIEFHTAGGITISADGSADDIFNITKCVFRDVTDAIAINNNNTAVTVNIGVCLMRNLSGEAVQLFDANPNVKILNCTIYDTNYALYDGSDAFTQVKNCVSMDNSNADYTADNQSYNCASDTSADGTGSLDSKNSEDNFTDASGDDFTILDTDADIYHAGNAISGESWFPADDLAGTSWNNPPSMGCFEYAAGGAISWITDIQGVSTTPSISHTTSRALSVSIAGASTTPSIVATLIRGLITNIQGQSTTPEISSTLARALLTDIQGASTTSEISVVIARALTADIQGSSVTPSIAAIIQRALSANIIGSSTTPGIVINIIRSLITNILGSSVTPEITITMEGAISWIANIVGLSVTPSISQTMSRNLSVDIQGASTTPSIAAIIARSLIASIAGSSVTPEITISTIRSLIANIIGSSVTPEITAILEGAISWIASIAGISTTPEITIDLIRGLQANIQGQSITPNDVIATWNEILFVVDPSIISLTPERVITSLTPIKTIESITPVRTIEEI